MRRVQTKDFTSVDERRGKLTFPLKLFRVSERVSGAINAGVPAVLDSIASLPSNWLLTPKSAIFTWPSSPSSRFEGLMSLWTIFWQCTEDKREGASHQIFRNTATANSLWPCSQCSLIFVQYGSMKMRFLIQTTCRGGFLQIQIRFLFMQLHREGQAHKLDLSAVRTRSQSSYWTLFPQHLPILTN